MKVKNAVIFAAGYGTRMLPVTAAVQKDLLPILDRPCIDYIVRDCLQAGVRNFTIVIRPGSHGLQDFYAGNAVLESHLERFGKKDALAKLRAIRDEATFSFVEQPADAGYGTAVPLMIAIPHLPANSPVLVSNGDDPFWREDGGSNMKDMVDLFEASGGEGVVVGVEKPEEVLHKYGVFATREENGHEFLTDLVEKPAPGHAPSKLINAAKYIMTPKVLEYVTRVKPDPKTGELYVTDAVRDAALDHKIAVYKAKGDWLDCGSVQSWLHANLIVAKSRPDIDLG